MAIEVATAISDDIDPADACEAVLRSARASLRGPVRGAILYATPGYDNGEVLGRIADGLGDVPLVGCSTSGLIAGAGKQLDDGVLLVLIGGDVRCASTVVRDLGEHNDEPARAAAASLIERLPDTRMLLMHPQSIGVDGEGTVRGAQRGAPGVLVVGANAGEFTGVETTTQFYGREVLTRASTMLAIAGDFTASAGVGGGWRPMGRRFRVTRTDGRTLLAVDGRPVLDVLREYANPEGAKGPLSDTPYAVYPREGGMYLLAVERVDVERGGIVFLSRLPQDAEIQTTSATVDEVLDGARISVRAAAADHRAARVEAALVFSCTARKWFLGSRVGEECEAHRAALGDVPIVGFYAHGEIAPIAGREGAVLHNQTCVTVLLGG